MYGIYLGYIGTMEKNMEAIIIGYIHIWVIMQSPSACHDSKGSASSLPGCTLLNSMQVERLTCSRHGPALNTGKIAPLIG